jgi:competence protein ComEC
MTKSRLFIGCAVSFSAGILLESKFDFSWPRVILSGGVVVAAWAVAHQSRKSGVIAVIFLWLLCASLGMARMRLAVKPNEYQAILKTKQQLDAVIVADVDVRADKQMLTVRPKGYSQNILITTSKYRGYFYGDRLLLSGKLAEPKAGSDFDYKAYLLRWNTYALMSYPKIIVLKNNQGHWWVRGLLAIKYAFIRQVNKVLPEVESNLLLGILIGARKALPDEVINNFNATGVSHVIAISGYNISIIVSGLGFLDRKFGRRFNFWLTLSVILAFVIMSGASASVIRAALMGGLVLVSSRVGRLYAITPALCAAASAMLVLNPRILYWDASFQLSFLATAGVVYIAPLLESFTETWPGLLGIKSIILTTLSAIIATLPFMLLQFGRLSIVAPLVNILILPLVPTSMLFGFLTGLPALGQGFGLLAHWLLGYMLFITAYFAHLKYASIEVHASQTAFALCYAVLAGGYAAARFWLKRRLKAGTLRESDSMIQ